uniref:Uncharacterized protein n=1 Tax=Tanacetum cinerariifolium TaxID=118510 RepID=A0A6L2NFP0_TANCI|nr:hypothetical protein [Tanacetum cinerariifolium]
MAFVSSSSNNSNNNNGVNTAQGVYMANEVNTASSQVSDDDEEKVEKKEVKPSINWINFVKATTDNNPREIIKNSEQPKQNTQKERGNHRNWNGMMSHRQKQNIRLLREKKSNVVKASTCWGNPQEHLQDKGVIDSGCSRHMTGNMSFLTDYEEIDEGYISDVKVESPTIKETVVDKEESSKHRRKIADIDADAEVNLENVYNLDMAHEDTILSSAAPTNITTAQPSEATKTTVDITTSHKAKGIVFHDKEESTIRIASLISQAKDKSKAKIETEWNANMKDNIDWNEVVKQVQSRQSDAVRKYQALKRKFIKEKVEKDQPAKKQKGDELEHDNAKKQKLEEQEEAEELKKNLEIVPDDEDDDFMNVTPLSSKPLTIVDYKIYKEGKKEHFLIFRVNGSHQMYLAFSTTLKNFDREYLEVL